MSSGVVKTNRRRRPDIWKSNGVKVAFPGWGVPNFSTSQLTFANPVTSYRSGPSFERAWRSPGAILSENSLAGALLSAAGDTGHEFSMRKVSKYMGTTRSRRPNLGFSPWWDTLTNPTPVSLTGSGLGLNPLVKFYDKSYSFCSTDSDLVTLGTSFVKTSNPIQTQVDLLSDIAEAVANAAVLPSLLGKQIFSSLVNPRRRSDLIKATGGEYLNFIFGYKPLADDAAKVGVLIDTVNKLVDQWIKDNGTIVRRRRVGQGKNGSLDYVEWKHLEPSTGVNASFWKPDPGALDVAQQSLGFVDSAFYDKIELSGHVYRSIEQKLTFSAGFEYDLSRLYLPVAGDSAAEMMHNAALRNRLKLIAFGLDPASIPVAAYNAIPFSWLLDYFVNIGDLIDNFRGLQARGVQMLWGYLTETSYVTCDLLARAVYLPTGEEFFRSSGVSAQKAIRRIRASPFGFGFSVDGLSQSQTQTLAALVVAKGL